MVLICWCWKGVESETEVSAEVKLDLELGWHDRNDVDEEAGICKRNRGKLGLRAGRAQRIARWPWFCSEASRGAIVNYYQLVPGPDTHGGGGADGCAFAPSRNDDSWLLAVC